MQKHCTNCNAGPERHREILRRVRHSGPASHAPAPQFPAEASTVPAWHRARWLVNAGLFPHSPLAARYDRIHAASAASQRTGWRGERPIRMDRIECQWCKELRAEADRTSCSTCRAPLDAKNLVSDSGWAEAPRLRDMTEFRFSNSTCQIEGEIVPVADMALGAGDSVFFEHHVMLWKEPAVPISALSTGGGMKRMLRRNAAHANSVAHGPGRVAFSRDATGEVVVLPPAPVHRARRARACNFPGRDPLADLFLRPDQGHGQRAARRRRHVHRSFHHRARARACCSCTAAPTSSRRRCSRARRSWSSRAAFYTRTRR